MNPFVVIGITLAASAFFSGIEIAFVSSNKLRIELEKGRGLLPARLISGFVHRPSRFIGAMLLGNNISLVIYGMAASALLTPFFGGILPPALSSEGIMLVLQTLCSTMVILIVAEFLPKILFRLNPNGLLNFFAVPVYLIYIVLSPFMYVFIGLSELMLRYIFGLQPGAARYQFTSIDFDDYIRDFYTPASVHTDESSEIRMIQNVRDFHATKVRECMVPRNEIIAADDDTPLSEITALVVESRHSKIPVYRESIDNLTGYLHIHDLFTKPQNLASVIRPVIIVPETLPASEALNMMIGQRRSVAVVVDEFGGTAGMVTIEDLIEEIFGEIEDEYDEDDWVEKKISDTEYIFSGRIEIDYLNREYELHLPESDEYETLAGLILNHHQSLPGPRDVIRSGPFVFTIIESGGNRISKVNLKILT
jgi:putative hemolysin